MPWLINSMINDIGENFLLYGTTKEIWDTAKETYCSNENTSKLFEIESILHDLYQGDMSITQYFNTLTRHWQQLDMFKEHDWDYPEDGIRYKKIIKKRKRFKFFMRLIKNLDEVRGTLLGSKLLPYLRNLLKSPQRREPIKENDGITKCHTYHRKFCPCCLRDSAP